MIFMVANCQHGDRNQLVRRSTLDLDRDSAHGQPARYLARPTNTDDGLEDIRWIHGLGGKSLSAASYGILPNLKKNSFCVLRYPPKPEENHFLPFETDTAIVLVDNFAVAQEVIHSCCCTVTYLLWYANGNAKYTKVFATIDDGRSISTRLSPRPTRSVAGKINYYGGP